MECYSSLLNFGALAADGLHRADLRLRERRNAADKKTESEGKTSRKEEPGGCGAAAQRPPAWLDV